MMKRPSLMICSCLLLSLLLLVGCTSKEISKAREAYTNGDYRTVVDLLENMKKLKAEDVELLNHAKIHLTFEAGNYEQVLEMIDTAEYRDEDMASLYEKAREAVEEAEALKRAAEEMAAEVPKADFEFDVDTEYSIDGQTHYAISQQEYDQLVAEVNRHIDDELNNSSNKNNFAQFPDFESVTSNEDRTRYTIVINNANFSTSEEFSLPEKLASLSKMYAQYTQKGIRKVVVEYKTMLGDPLYETELNASSTATPAEILMEDSSTPSSEAQYNQNSGA